MSQWEALNFFKKKPARGSSRSIPSYTAFPGYIAVHTEDSGDLRLIVFCHTLLNSSCAKRTSLHLLCIIWLSYTPFTSIRDQYKLLTIATSSVCYVHSLARRNQVQEASHMSPQIYHSTQSVQNSDRCSKIYYVIKAGAALNLHFLT